MMDKPFPLPLKRPIIFFDLETTGLDFKYDRVIEIGAVKIYPDGHREPFCRRVNPGIRIPAEVTQLTGITNEQIAEAPTFVKLLPEISDYFKDADLAGYHINRFDVKMLAEEFRRAGQNFDTENRLVLDAQVIFHQKEKRDLAAALMFYCEKEMKNAHSAQADTEATIEIFLAQLERYKDLPRSVEDLHAFCRTNQDRFVDSEGKFFWRDGEAVFNFGKFKSQTLRSVAKTNPEYLQWVISPERQFSQEMIDICYKAMRGEFPVRKSE